MYGLRGGGQKEACAYNKWGQSGIVGGQLQNFFGRFAIYVRKFFALPVFHILFHPWAYCAIVQ